MGSTFCSVVALDLLFEYQVIDFSSGDVLSLCSISDAGSQYSGQYFYRSTQPAAATARCFVTYDLDIFSGGSWEFTMTGATTATYTDTGSASNGSVVAFAPTDCT